MSVVEVKGDVGGQPGLPCTQCRLGSVFCTFAVVSTPLSPVSQWFNLEFTDNSCPMIRKSLILSLIHLASLNLFI